MFQLYACAEHVFYALEVLPENQTRIFFIMKKEFVNKLDFLHSSTSYSENSPLRIRKTRHHYRKTLNVDQLLHRIQTEETNDKNVFLQLDNVPSDINY